MIFLINYYLSFYKVCYTPFSDSSFQPITFESRVRGTPMTHAYDSMQANPCQVNIRLVAPYWIWWSCWTLYFIGEEKVSHCLVALLVFTAILQLQCYCKIKRKEEILCHFSPERLLLVFCVFFSSLHQSFQR